MNLFSYYRSSCSYRVRIALNYKNIDYTYLPVHLVKEGGEQYKKDYVDMNPKAEVPTLQDQHITLSQSVAIFFYLDRKYLNPSILPKPFPDFERCLELMEIVNSGTQPLQNVSVLKKLVKEHGFSEEDKVNWCKHFIGQGLKAYQSKIETGAPFSLGEEPTAADMFLIPQLFNAHRFGIDMTEMQPLLKIEENCLSLEAFKKAHPSNQPDTPKEN